MTTAFHALHHADQPLLLPNAWDHASAAALIQAGFGAIGTTSLGVAAAYGIPDGQNAAGPETLALAGRLSHLPCLLSVDIEGGFGGGPEEVAEYAAALAATGAVGINLEDGRANGSLVPVAEQSALIEAVKARVPSLFVNARTDVYWLAGDGEPDQGAALTRADAYLAAGADGIFVPGAADAGQVEALVNGIDAPLNVLYQPGRLTVQQLGELGVRRISLGSLLFRTALHAAVETARSVALGQPVAAGIPSYAEAQRLSEG